MSPFRRPAFCAAVSALLAWVLCAAPLAQGAPAHLDPRFGDHGSLFLPASLADLLDAALLPDGRVVVAASDGVTSTGGGLTALLPSGRIDRSFGAHGRASFGGPEGAGSIEGVAVDPAGRPVATGVAPGPDGPLSEEPVIERLTPQGTPDPSFGEGSGRVALSPPGSASTPEVLASGIGFDPSGHIYLTGQSRPASITGPGPAQAQVGEGFLARFEESGRLDPSFASSGVLLYPAPSSLHTTVGPTGQVLVLSDVGGTGSLARLEGDGEPDPGFAPGVEVQPTSTALSDAAGRTILLAVREGKSEAYSREFQIRRLNPDGSLDHGFGRGGVATVRLPGLQAVDLQLDESGRVMIAASQAMGHGSHGRIFLMRLSAAGRVERSFGHRGVLAIPIAGRPDVSLDDFEVRYGRAFLAGDTCGEDTRCGTLLAMVDLGEG